MIWSIAWRNVWRNKLRSSVIIIAITLGMAAGVFSTAFMKGVSEQRIRTAIETEGLAHLQIHQEKFTDNLDTKKFITQADEIVQDISKDKNVEGVSKRIIINTLAATAQSSTGVKVWGIDPENEKKISNLNTKIVEGEYFKGVKRNPIVIGKELAEKLKVKVRSKIILRFNTLSGVQTAGAFKVAGIFETANSTFEEMNVFVEHSDVAKLVGLPKNAAHEIPVLLTDKEKLDSKLNQLKQDYAGLDVKPWNKLSPEVGFMDEMMDQYMYMFIVIILLALCFGIINTMLMVVLERVKELGMLMAVGMNRTKVFGMIMLETVFLTLTGGLIGIGLGVAASKYFGVHGLDLSAWGEGLGQLGYDTMAYPVIKPDMTIMIIILVILTGILSSVYPALKALKFRPAEALRTE